ncbi:MAG: hypothetical protein ACR2KW_10150 [Rubrobacter sp.]
MNEALKAAETYLSRLSEETMDRAWKELSQKGRRRIAVGAILFGQRLDETLAKGDPQLVYEQDVQRLLMKLMNDVISDFARIENLSTDEAGAFLSDVANRDRIFEFNEVIDAFEVGESDETLNELLEAAVGNRRDHALWADHWTSG